MRIRLRRTWVLVGLLLLVVGVVGYPVSMHIWATHHYRAAERAIARRDFRQAAVHLDKCLKTWPKEPNVLLLAAQTARRRGQFAEARGHLDAFERNRGPRLPLELELR